MNAETIALLESAMIDQQPADLAVRLVELEQRVTALEQTAADRSR